MACKRLLGLELTTSFYQEASREQIPASWFCLTDRFEIIIENFMPVNFPLDSVLGYVIYDFNRTLAFFIVLSRLFSSLGKIIDLL